MDERNLRIAFAKVKKDILSIKDDLHDLSKEKNSTKEDFSDKLKFDNFVKNVENELKALTLYTKELDDKIEHNGKATVVKTSSTSNKDIEDNLEQLEGKFGDFTELVNEKVEMEISSLRLEFTEEVAKIYDRIFTEILELKDEMNNNSEKKKEEKPKKKSKKTSKKKVEEENKDELYSSVSEQTGKKPGKMKKVMNWLFVDEEDDEMEDIKSEVKNVKEEDKEGLY